MASDPFDFSDVFADLEKKIDDFMKDDTTKEVASRMFAESTQELVYDKYPGYNGPVSKSPNYYDEPPETRRYENDGLKDWHNYHVMNIGKMNMTIINETKGASVWATGFGPYPSEGWDAGYINDIIENGVGYHWTGSLIYQLQPYPRPFMEKALDKFTDDYLLPSIHKAFFND